MNKQIVIPLLLCLVASHANAQHRLPDLRFVDANNTSRSKQVVTPTRPMPQIQLAQTPGISSQAANPLYGLRSKSPRPAALRSNKIPVTPNAIVYNPSGLWTGGDKVPSNDVQTYHLDVYHQPLIQIKLRIIEVVREDVFAGKTVLDYLRLGSKDSLITSNTLNGGMQGSTTSTRFAEFDEGGLINIKTGKLDFYANLLATEFKADLITCPQVVTLNGQKVQLLSGANVPFELGQSVLRDGSLAVQETFYKHIGTNLTVTPRIINWGPRGEGKGRRPIVARDVVNWNKAAGLALHEKLYEATQEDAFKEQFQKYVSNSLLIMTVKDRRDLLDALNRHDRLSIDSLWKKRRGDPKDELFDSLDSVTIGESSCPCDWKPSDCTIDVELVLRQSNTGTKAAVDLTDKNRGTVDISKEEIGAALATIVQLKSGHGAVVAGLIGGRDIRLVSKVPLLGDVPWLGAAFRSKTTDRQKTEIVIFLEAEILPSDSYQAAAKAAQDFELTQDYMHDNVLSNPLEIGMQRAGIGSYLPPRTWHERVYWERLGRKVQKSTTAASDIIR